MPKKSILAMAAPALATVVAFAAGSPTHRRGHSPPPPPAPSCSPSKLALHTSGVLTVATDAPAYPPYFENNKPANGKGFESAVAYAVAKQLGFGTEQGQVGRRAVRLLLRPGPEELRLRHQRDLDHAARARRRSRSRPRTTRTRRRSSSPRARRSRTPSRWPRSRTRRSAFRSAPPACRRPQQVIKPTQQPQVFNTSNDVVSAFKIHRVDAIIVDYATALYLTSAEIKHDHDRRPVHRARRRQLGPADEEGLDADRRAWTRRSAKLKANGTLDESDQALDVVQGRGPGPQVATTGSQLRACRSSRIRSSR